MMAALHFIYSTMNAGKSTALLQASHGYRERGLETMVFTSSKDDRYGLSCILIDEAQFLTKDQVKQLGKIVDELKITVMAFGIRTDFQGELFEGSKYLLAWADKLKELRAVCHCGSKATMIVRVSEDGSIMRSGDQVEIGGNERYLSLCRKCFYSGTIGP